MPGKYLFVQVESEASEAPLLIVIGRMLLLLLLLFTLSSRFCIIVVINQKRKVASEGMSRVNPYCFYPLILCKLNHIIPRP